MIGNENYTMSIYEIINNFYSRPEVETWFKDYELSDYLTLEQIQTIENTGIWSKDKLAKKIVDHYLMEQIGFETMGLFKHQVKIKMQELMESKLPLIYSSAIQYDPLVNVDYTETFERNIDQNGEVNTLQNSTLNNNSSSSGLDVSSDTPQGQISKSSILEGNYATSTNANENESANQETQNLNNNTTNQNNTDENYTKRVKGNSGVSATAQRMIQQYRENIYSIDKSIIDELNDLFMIIY